jgi:hypothetical protein
MRRLTETIETKIAMKTFPLIAAALLIACAGYSQTLTYSTDSSSTPGASPAAAPAKKPPVNYLVRVDWLQPKSESKFLEVLTTEGAFNVNTIQKNPVKINNNDIPVTLNLQGTLTAINDEKGRLQLYLGRTVPYVTSTYGNGSNTQSSYSQLSVGLNSNIIVTYGKPVVIQNDENGQISVLVKRVAD